MVGITHIRTVKMCALQCNECSSLSIRLFFLPFVFFLGELLARLNVLTKILPANLCESRGLEFFWKKPYFHGYCYPLWLLLNLCIIFKSAISRKGGCREFYIYINWYKKRSNFLQNRQGGSELTTRTHRNVGWISFASFYALLFFFW